VVTIDAQYGSDDFGLYGRVARVPSVQLRVGAPEPEAFARAKAAGKLPPGPHTSLFAPDRERTIRTSVAAQTVSVLELCGASK
jgi:hippurate hydrolase